MTTDPIQILVAIAPAVAIYVAIRVDIASLSVRMQRAEQDIQAIFKGPKQ
jgi:hypothetical protein